MIKENRIGDAIVASLLFLSPTAATAGTVAHWKLADGPVGSWLSSTASIKDSSPNALHGTPFGDPVFYETCPCNVGLLFDGVNDRVFVPDDPKLALTKSLTMEAVIRLDALPSASWGQIVFRGDKPPGHDPYWLAVTPDGRVVSVIDDGITPNMAYSPNPLLLGHVTHVAGTLDDATGKHELFINGISVGTTITNVRAYATLTGPSPGIGIGNLQDATPQYFRGEILEVRISDHARTPSEFLSSCVPGQIKNYGTGCPGLGGIVPALSMEGCPIAGGNMNLTVGAAAPHTLALVVLGLFEVAVPAAGPCAVNVSPMLPNVFPLPIGGVAGVPGAGSVLVPFEVPPGSLGGTVKLQAFVADPANPWGYSATNGTSVTIAPW